MGKASDSDVVPIVVTNVVSNVVPQDMNRRMLLLGSASGGTITYSTDQTFALGQGITLSTGQPPIIMNRDHWGKIVQQPWYAIGAAASTNACYAYSHLNEQELK